MRKEITINGEISHYSGVSDKNSIAIELNGKKFIFNNVSVDNENIYFEFNGENKSLSYFTHSGSTFCDVSGKSFHLKKVEKNFSKSSVGSGEGLVSPMPGKIIKVCREVGDLVKSGDAIIVMEAMKMEHTLSAPNDGVVKSINAKEGELVEGGLHLVELGEVDDSK